jgi:hypothetical protein
MAGSATETKSKACAAALKDNISSAADKRSISA